ncbi:MAG: PEGA domain-containing protein [Candidatus Micrarchaeaceae archaeon]
MRITNLAKDLIVGAAALSMVGCATLIHGSSQTVPVTTDPPGASLSVNEMEYVTPVDLSLDRNKGYQVTASKSGYESQTIEIHSNFSAVSFVDLIFIIPWAVDLADGASYTLTPESIQMTLKPTVAPIAAAAKPS